MKYWLLLINSADKLALSLVVRSCSFSSLDEKVTTPPNTAVNPSGKQAGGVTNTGVS